MLMKTKPSSTAGEIHTLMKRHSVTLDDVATVGWEPGLKCHVKIERCRRVARIWEMMAAANLTFAKLEANFG